MPRVNKNEIMRIRLRKWETADHVHSANIYIYICIYTLTSSVVYCCLFWIIDLSKISHICRQCCTYVYLPIQFIINPHFRKETRITRCNYLPTPNYTVYINSECCQLKWRQFLKIFQYLYTLIIHMFVPCIQYHNIIMHLIYRCLYTCAASLY